MKIGTHSSATVLLQRTQIKSGLLITNQIGEFCYRFDEENYLNPGVSVVDPSSMIIRVMVYITVFKQTFSFVYFEQLSQGLQYTVGIFAILQLIKELFQLKKQVSFLTASFLLRTPM